MMRKRSSAYKVFVLLQVFLTFEPSIKGEVDLVTFAKQRVVRNGQNLLLNCTVFGKDLRSNLVLQWNKVGVSSDIVSRKVANNTLQLQIPNTNKSDAGEYRCVVTRQGQVVNTTSVHVIVADLPAKPSAPSWRSINWHICFNWNPVSSTGGLPVTYRIRYRCLSQCDLDDDDNLLSNRLHEACKTTQPIPGREMKCCLDHVTVFLQYEAVVVAENALGSVTSSPVRFSRGIETTVGPPQALRARASGYGCITIDWTPSKDSMFWQIKYTVLYHVQGDSTNKTIVLDSNGQNHYRLTNLQPYTNYSVYVAGIGPIDEGVGIPAGPVVVRTNEENPSDAPEITNWDSVVYPENPERRNVTITWKLPPEVKWNGKIRSFIIQYREITGKQISFLPSNPWGESISIDSSSGNQGMLSNLRTLSAYEVEMQMCNGAGCGGIGDRVVIPGMKTSARGERRLLFSDQLIILVLILGTTVMVLFALIVLVCFRVKRITQMQDDEDPAKCYPMKRASYDRMGAEVPA